MQEQPFASNIVDLFIIIPL